MAADAIAKRRHSPGVRAIVRGGAVLVAACLLLTGAIYASQRIEQFVIHDPQFFLPGPPDYGLDSPNLELRGVQFASHAQILEVFERDYGRSIYFFPLAARRNSLRNAAWVHDASLQRIWPNRIRVEITERKPAAFVRLPAEGMSRWALIDDEGVILDPPRKAVFRLPVLTGILPGEGAGKRSLRVRRMQGLIRELGPLAQDVSEVDASDLENLKIIEQAGGRSVTLLVGGQNFAWRVRSFRDHYPEIHRKLPRATTFDLRLDDRITGVEGTGDAR